ncbi:MAG: acetoacetate decarboxylase family protein [Frankiaceae bacterium]|nr:acetoacetate decarboxylase family protein [Frankiaceae bacterium]
MASSYDILGTTVAMPVEVRDASAGTAVFEVDAVAAGALLPAGFEVAEVSPGRAHLALVVVDYRDNDLGSYHEVGVMFFVRPADGGGDGTFIVRLPVDQPFTCEAGQVIWGFPKTLEEIDLDYSDTAVSCTLRMDGELVLRLCLPREADAAAEMPPTPMTAYTVIDGLPHATTFTQGGAGFSMGFDAIELELGTHPVAKELAALGMSPTPAFTTWTEHMRATFEEPRPL